MGHVFGQRAIIQTKGVITEHIGTQNEPTWHQCWLLLRGKSGNYTRKAGGHFDCYEQ